MSDKYSNTSMLDMVFEHRNKAYGAYVLRRDYNNTLKQAMLSIVCVITLFCFGNYIRENIHAGVKNGYKPNSTFTATDIGKITPPAPQKQILPPPTPKHQEQARGIKTAADPEKKVVANNKAPEDSIPATKDLANVESGLKANTTADPGLGTTDGNGRDHVLDVAKQVEPVKSDVFKWVEKMPEFPGGEEALLKFIARNTEYPRMERTNDIGGKVLTQFTVNEDGTISDIQILRSPSNGFNKEVTRVIKMLPAFKPGIQQGRAVKVRYNLPFTFRLD